MHNLLAIYFQLFKAKFKSLLLTEFLAEFRRNLPKNISTKSIYYFAIFIHNNADIKAPGCRHYLYKSGDLYKIFFG